MEAGEVTCGKIPEKGRPGWLQEEGKGMLWSKVCRRDGEAQEPGSAPSPLRSWLQAFRGARHSTVLFLIRIYSTAAMSDFFLSEDPACGRT